MGQVRLIASEWASTPTGPPEGDGTVASPVPVSKMVSIDLEGISGRRLSEPAGLVGMCADDTSPSEEVVDGRRLEASEAAWSDVL